MLRNSSEQLGARSESWNNRVYDVVEAIHHGLGIDLNDPVTTWRWATYKPPRNASHEADAPNSWHLAILVFCASVVALQAIRGAGGERALFALALACGFVAFCAYLKWQPFMGRLFLPLFVLGAPLTSLLGEVRMWRGVMPILLAVFLINNARRPLLENWVRPLKGPRSVLHTPRDDQYFSDMSQWGNSETYRRTVDFLAGNPCGIVGVDVTNLQLEYPLQALLRERRPEILFLHTGVQNASAKYAQPVEAQPCAVVCLECVNDVARLQRYQGFATRVSVGTSVILMK